MTSRQFANEQVMVVYSKLSYCITSMSLRLVREARTKVYMHSRPMYWYHSHNVNTQTVCDVSIQHTFVLGSFSVTTHEHESVGGAAMQKHLCDQHVYGLCINNCQLLHTLLVLLQWPLPPLLNSMACRVIAESNTNPSQRYVHT